MTASRAKKGEEHPNLVRVGGCTRCVSRAQAERAMSTRAPLTPTGLLLIEENHPAIGRFIVKRQITGLETEELLCADCVQRMRKNWYTITAVGHKLDPA